MAVPGSTRFAVGKSHIVLLFDNVVYGCGRALHGELGPHLNSATVSMLSKAISTDLFICSESIHSSGPLPGTVRPISARQGTSISRPATAARPNTSRKGVQVGPSPSFTITSLFAGIDATFVAAHMSIPSESSAPTAVLFACGNNTSSKLGIPDVDTFDNDLYIHWPTEVAAFRGIPIASVACGLRHSLFLAAGHGGATSTVFVAGEGDEGQLGCGPKVRHIASPQRLALGDDVEPVDIAVGSLHSLVAVVRRGCSDGEGNHTAAGSGGFSSNVEFPQYRLYAFGFNGSGQLGLGHTLTMPQRIFVPTLVMFFDDVKLTAIAAGRLFSAFGTSGGLFVCGEAPCPIEKTDDSLDVSADGVSPAPRKKRDPFALRSLPMPVAAPPTCGDLLEGAVPGVQRLAACEGVLLSIWEGGIVAASVPERDDVAPDHVAAEDDYDAPLGASIIDLAFAPSPSASAVPSLGLGQHTKTSSKALDADSGQGKYALLPQPLVELDHKEISRTDIEEICAGDGFFAVLLASPSVGAANSLLVRSPALSSGTSTIRFPPPSIYLWGNNASGQCGIPVVTRFVESPQKLAITAAYAHLAKTAPAPRVNSAPACAALPLFDTPAPEPSPDGGEEFSSRRPRTALNLPSRGGSGSKVKQKAASNSVSRPVSRRANLSAGSSRRPVSSVDDVSQDDEEGIEYCGVIRNFSVDAPSIGEASSDGEELNDIPDDNEHEDPCGHTLLLSSFLANLAASDTPSHSTMCSTRLEATHRPLANRFGISDLSSHREILASCRMQAIVSASHDEAHIAGEGLACPADALQDVPSDDDDWVVERRLLAASEQRRQLGRPVSGFGPDVAPISRHADGDRSVPGSLSKAVPLGSTLPSSTQPLSDDESSDSDLGVPDDPEYLALMSSMGGGPGKIASCTASPASVSTGSVSHNTSAFPLSSPARLKKTPASLQIPPSPQRSVPGIPSTPPGQLDPVKSPQTSLLSMRSPLNPISPTPRPTGSASSVSSGASSLRGLGSGGTTPLGRNRLKPEMTPYSPQSSASSLSSSTLPVGHASTGASTSADEVVSKTAASDTLEGNDLGPARSAKFSRLPRKTPS